MKLRTILPLIFFSLFTLSQIAGFFISPVFSLIGMLIGIFLVFSIYASYSTIIKEEELYINNTRLQNFMMGFSSFALFTILFGITFKLMHWPFAGPILILSVIVCLIPLLLLIIDVVINYKSVKTSYGYSYLLILLPSLLFLQTNLGIFYKDINSKDMIALKQTDDHRQLYCNRQDKINCLFIERNFKEDSLITKIYKTTEELLSLIDETRNKLIASTGGYIEGDKNGMYKGAREKTTVEVMMVGASKNGRAYELKSVLEAYTSLLNKNIADNAFLIIPIALDAKDDPVVTDWDLKRKDFASLNFSEVTMLQALSKLSQLELEVIIAEKDFLLYYQSTHKEIPPTNN